jgi:Trypsin-like peptidase domain
MSSSNSLDRFRTRRSRRSLPTATAALVLVFAIAGLGVATPEASANAPSAGRVLDGATLAAFGRHRWRRAGCRAHRRHVAVPERHWCRHGRSSEPGRHRAYDNHVIRGATDITATNVSNGQTYTAAVLGYDRKSDVAVLQLRGASDLPVAPTADSSGVRAGDQVTAVGYPDGGDFACAPGTVRALDQNIVADDELTGSARNSRT